MRPRGGARQARPGRCHRIADHPGIKTEPPKGLRLPVGSAAAVIVVAAAVVVAAAAVPAAAAAAPAVPAAAEENDDEDNDPEAAVAIITEHIDPFLRALKLSDCRPARRTAGKCPWLCVLAPAAFAPLVP